MRIFSSVLTARLPLSSRGRPSIRGDLSVEQLLLLTDCHS